VRAEPKILRGATYLLVADVAATGTYYESVLGFRREYAAGDPPEFAIYSRDGSTVMFRRALDAGLICPKERQGGTWDVFHWVQSVDALHEELKGRGATIVYPPTVQAYGMKEFAVRDPTGYVHGFGQEWQAQGVTNATSGS
jgi:uncharacterized glyoxalase superfamily protein PhnB